MKIATKTAWLVLAALLPATVVGAESLEEKRWKEREEKTWSPQVEKINKACDTKIEGKIDWSTFKFDEWQTSSPATRCESVAWVVAAMCGKADGKAAVQKAIKALNCRNNDPTKLELKAGVLDYSVTLKKSLNQDDMKKYLLKNI